VAFRSGFPGIDSFGWSTPAGGGGALAGALGRAHAPGTLLALHRAAEPGGAIRERFRTLRPRDETAFSAGHLRGHDRAFHLIETDEAEDGHGIDLVALGDARRDGQP